MKYRITFEQIDAEAGTVPQEILEPVECNGFCIMANCGDYVNTRCTNITEEALVQAIMHSKKLFGVQSMIAVETLLAMKEVKHGISQIEA